MIAGPQLSLDPMSVAWGVGARPLPGEIESGDLHLVAPFRRGVLIAVVDGLGHGPDAAVAARAAVATLREHPDEPVTSLMQRCHAALLKTRGAVLSLASIHADTNLMTWLGVGNVDGTLHRADRGVRPARESLPCRGGVAGYQLPPLRAASLLVAPGDTLVLATDGIGGSFNSESPLDRHPQEMADHIVARYGKETDDALALVVRYVGRAP